MPAYRTPRAAPSATALRERRLAALEAAGWIVVERPDGWAAEMADGSRGVYATTFAELVRRIETPR